MISSFFTCLWFSLGHILLLILNFPRATICVYESKGRPIARLNASCRKEGKERRGDAIEERKVGFSYMLSCSHVSNNVASPRNYLSLKCHGIL